MHTFELNENIDPNIINANHRELQTLIAQAVTYNQALRARYDMMNNIIANLVLPAPNGALNTSISDTSDGRLFIPAIVLDGGSVVDGFELTHGLLGLEAESESSLIATSMNSMFGERVPAAGAVITADDNIGSGIELINPELIFSPDAMWAQVVSVPELRITGTFPPGLTNQYNTVAVSGALHAAGTSVRGLEVTNSIGYQPESYFDYEVELISKGLSLGDRTYLHSVGMVRVSNRVYTKTSSTLTFIVTATPAGKTGLNYVELDFASNLNAQLLSDIASITIYHADDPADELYNSESDTYPLASSLTIVDGEALLLSITLKQYNNSSPLLRGVRLGFI